MGTAKKKPFQAFIEKIRTIAHQTWLKPNGLPKKQQAKRKPLHELSEHEKDHLRRSGRYIPVKLTFWQELRANTANSIKNAVSFKTLGQAVNASVLIGAITFIAGEQQRRASQVYQAWQVITIANGQSGSGGRIQALEFLNSQPRRIPWFWLHWERESLSGLEAPKAYLVPSRKDRNFEGIQLQEARLDRANLQEAILIRANLQGARLDRANLQGARLYSANLQGAKLDRANLQGAKYTDKNTSQKTCKEIFMDYPCPTIFPPNFDPKTKGMIPLK